MFHYHYRLFIPGICIMIVIIVLVIIIHLHPKPPSYQIALSRKALSKANHANAENYAPGTFNEAERNWQKILKLWRQENKKAFYRRNYNQLERLAEQTRLVAQESERQAAKARDSLKNVARIELALLLEKVAEFKTQFGQMPIDESLRKNAIRGELLVLEGQAALKREQVKHALHKFKLAEQLIGQSGNEVSEMLNEYLSNIPLWRRWSQETVTASKDNQDLAIIIDKFNHTLYIYDNGQLTNKYPIELGKNWIGHKKQKGDNATPEGQYTITRKIQNGQSKYYKALVINYPNQKDLQDFLIAKQQGKLPKNAQIGGSIEIHGEGGKGINWTQGCIALTNDDLDKIFDRVKIGTPVTIVGSLNGAANNKTSNLQRQNKN
jgi:hypothetical protein